MLMRTDPFRELDRFAQQVLGTPTRPAAMPIDAYRRNDTFIVEFDLPGVEHDSIDHTVEKASYADGVLRLTVPVAERAKARRVPIATASDATTVIDASSKDEPSLESERADEYAGSSS
jgi:HSP20 family molecular chaperone IbpA